MVVFESDFKHSTENWLEMKSIKGKDFILFIQREHGSQEINMRKIDTSRQTPDVIQSFRNVEPLIT